jgi:Gram-negative bacterial TonB protein C-terminal
MYSAAICISLLLLLWPVHALGATSAASIHTALGSDVLTRCIAHLSDSPQSPLAPFFGDQGLIQRTCVCVATVADGDSGTRQAIEAIGSTVDGRGAASTHTVLAATMLSCAAKEIQATSQMNGDVLAFVRRLSAASLKPDHWPDFQVAQLNADTCGKPAFPALSQQANAEGISVLSALVSELGEVVDVRVVQSAGPTIGHKLLDFTALTASYDCRFAPGRLVRRPTSSWVVIKYEWKLAEVGK